jgi:phosphate starvation-inducible PhoH-like protein
MKKSTRKITLDVHDKLTTFFKENIKNQVFADLCSKYRVTLKINNVGMLVIKGDKAGSSKLQNSFKKLSDLRRQIRIEDVSCMLEERPVTDLAEYVEDDNSSRVHNDYRIDLRNNRSYTSIKAKTRRQQEFIDAILNKKVILGMGSPGTGKSFIALTVALKLLQLKKVHKIIISKPPIESGPSIGFLPGTQEDKMGPYIASIMSILTELVGAEGRDKLIASGDVQIENIGYLRGMTLGNRESVVYILDEAQNVEFAQHKLILTRLGDKNESRIIMCGDQNQSDLKYKKDTLSKIHSIIKDSPYVGSVVFQREDVVRSEVVKDLLGRIETWEEMNSNKESKNFKKKN